MIESVLGADGVPYINCLVSIDYNIRYIGLPAFAICSQKALLDSLRKFHGEGHGEMTVGFLPHRFSCLCLPKTPSGCKDEPDSETRRLL
jgi:hypothetical protein